MSDPASDPTFQTVIDALASVPRSPSRSARTLTSAIYVFARALDRQPSEVPAKIDIVERLGATSTQPGSASPREGWRM